MKLFVKRDLDGFFGLFVDNLVQVLTIIAFCSTYCGMTGEDSRYLYELILPGVAVSVLFGNFYYAWQAYRLGRQAGRDDYTALPYGINTPSVIVFVFFIIAPEYGRTQSVAAAWKLGLLACLGSGVIEFVGAFFANWIRRNTPRAALLATLSGIAIGFISMTFALQIFQKPLIAMIPLGIVLLGLFGRVRFPLSLPSGFLAILAGTGCAWLLTYINSAAPGAPGWLTYGALDPAKVDPAIRVHYPQWTGGELLEAWRGLTEWIPFLSVVVPMGLFNVVGSLQNIESAEAAGDRYPAASSMAVNGLGSILAACCGSCFPTTIYIGHPGWKEMGARAGYSALNGVVMGALATLGLLELMSHIIPIEAGAAIILWIGIIITAQAFRDIPQEHAPAVAVGLFPAIAAWGATVMLGTIMAAEGRNLRELIEPPPVVTAVVEGTAGAAQIGEVPPAEGAQRAVLRQPKSALEVNGFLVHGLLLLERGFIFSCMFLAAVSACLIHRQFGQAAGWMFVAAGCTALGLMHAYQVYEVEVAPEVRIATFDYLFQFVPAQPGAYAYRAYDIALGYLLAGLTIWIIGRWADGQPEAVGHA